MCLADVVVRKYVWIADGYGAVACFDRSRQRA